MDMDGYKKAPDGSEAFCSKWYRRPESNRHGLRHRCLRPTCLPIPPLRHGSTIIVSRICLSRVYTQGNVFVNFFPVFSTVNLLAINLFDRNEINQGVTNKDFVCVDDVSQGQGVFNTRDAKVSGCCNHLSAHDAVKNQVAEGWGNQLVACHGKQIAGSSFEEVAAVIDKQGFIGLLFVGNITGGEAIGVIAMFAVGQMRKRVNPLIGSQATAEPLIAGMNIYFFISGSRQ